MKTQKNPKEQIIDGAIARLNSHGPPFASYANIADAADLSRQLMRYYFPEPDTLMLEVCDTLSEAYRLALAHGAQAYDGSSKLGFMLDFYFGLIETPPVPENYGCNDAMVAFAAGNAKIKTALRTKYALMGQALQLEIKVAYPDLSLRTCTEMAYICLCIMHGNRKMTGSIGMNKDHSKIARKSIDRVFESYQNDSTAVTDGFEIWN